MMCSATPAGSKMAWRLIHPADFETAIGLDYRNPRAFVDDDSLLAKDHLRERLIGVRIAEVLAAR